MENNNQSSSSNNSADEEKKPGGTLNMQNISISTLKDDLAAEQGEKKEDKSGWFSFLAKHQQPAADNKLQASDDGQAVTDNKQPVSEETNNMGASAEPPTPNTNPLAAALGNANLKGVMTGQEEKKKEDTGDFLSEELERFKAENENKAVSSEDSAGVEAPVNLPVSDSGADSGLTKYESAQDVDLKVEQNIDKKTGENKSNDNETNERPALGSFFPPKPPEEESEEDGPLKAEPVGEGELVKNKLSQALSSSSIISGTSLESTENKPKIEKMEPEESKGVVAAIKEETPVEEEKSQNPFSSHLSKQEIEKKSLLNSVEAALNYSAPPEFSKQREVTEEKAEEEGSSVVDLRKKSSVKPGGIFSNKKFIIFGGVGLFVIILMVSMALFLGNKNSSNSAKSVAQNNTNNQENKNQNTNPVPVLKPTTTPTKPLLSPVKFLSNTQIIPIGSLDAIAEELDNLRQQEPLKKQTQLIFQKSDGSTISLADLADAMNFNVPQKIVAQPDSIPAMIFADFFKGQTVFGLVIPISDTPELTMSKMKNWESTMVLDMGSLWKGIPIDNPGAYFADSQLYTYGRFALVDKKNKLSLDYVVDNGKIFIACGRDSMSILQNNYIKGSVESSGGINWESDSTTKVSGVNTETSNPSASTTSSNSGSTSSADSSTSSSSSSASSGNLAAPSSSGSSDSEIGE